MNPQDTPESGSSVTEIKQSRMRRYRAAAARVQRWPALVTILAAMALYVTLPGHLYYGPVWLLPVVEGALIVSLLAARQMEEEGHEWQRAFVIGLIATMNLANLSSLFLLIHSLLSSAPVNHHKIDAGSLMLWSAQIWLTNVLVFALWYWELDCGGPVARCLPRHREPDFLFPQMVNPNVAPKDWTPSFFDYVYTSFTNAAAFSPTDTMPLSEWAKFLFMFQSSTSLVTAVLVIARIANILP